MRCVVELGFKLGAIYLQSLDLKLFSICITEGIAHLYVGWEQESCGIFRIFLARI